MRVHIGAIVFVSPHNVTRQPIGSAVELFPGESVAIDHQTAADEGSNPLAGVVAAALCRVSQTCAKQSFLS